MKLLGRSFPQVPAIPSVPVERSERSPHVRRDARLAPRSPEDPPSYARDRSYYDESRFTVHTATAVLFVYRDSDASGASHQCRLAQTNITTRTHAAASPRTAGSLRYREPCPSRLPAQVGRWLLRRYNPKRPQHAVTDYPLGLADAATQTAIAYRSSRPTPYRHTTSTTPNPENLTVSQAIAQLLRTSTSPPTADLGAAPEAHILPALGDTLSEPHRPRPAPLARRSRRITRPSAPATMPPPPPRRHSPPRANRIPQGRLNHA
jgi:hypothetical protein